MRILLSSICLETGTDIQLALYYLKGYLLKHPPLSASGRLPALRSCDITIRTFTEDLCISRIARDIARQKPRIIGFSCYVWNIEKTLSVCRLLKKIDADILIVLGGPEATPRAEDILGREPAVDIVVRGEGEQAFADCAAAVAAGCGFSRITAISWRQDGRVRSNPARNKDLVPAAIPSPYLSGLIDLDRKDIVDVPLETSRGCACRCAYCYYHKNFPRVRFFPLSRVEKELALILSHRPREVYLMDATFNAYPARAKKILRLFIRHNRGSNLHVELKAELLDEEMARLLAAARANNIEIGIQSLNPRTLESMHRPFNREGFRKGIELLNKYGLLYEIQLIDALPYQRYEDLQDALDWLYGLHPVKVALFPLSVLPGTALRASAARYGIQYSKRAPYRAYQSNAMRRQEVARVERLRFAMERLYDSQVFQKALYDLRDKAGIKISDILEDFISWSARLPGAGRITPEGYNRRLPEFLAYVLRKKIGVRHELTLIRV